MSASRMADPLYLSLWFSTFEVDDMLPHALAVMRQFSFSVAQPGITYLALHPVSWNEPTISNGVSGRGFHRKKPCSSRPTCA